MDICALAAEMTPNSANAAQRNRLPVFIGERGTEWGSRSWGRGSRTVIERASPGSRLRLERAREDQSAVGELDLVGLDVVDDQLVAEHLALGVGLTVDQAHGRSALVEGDSADRELDLLEGEHGVRQVLELAQA